MILYCTVGFNIKYNNYTWKRDPYLKKDINLVILRSIPVIREKQLILRLPPQDNHAVSIDKYYFTYTSDGKTTKKVPDYSCHNFFAISSLLLTGTQYPGLGVKIQLKRHLTYHVIQTYIPR